MKLVIIAAVSENNVIGVGGKLPWHISADLALFKRLTYNHTVIMGRVTFESIGKVLTRRNMIVISNTMDNREDIVIVPDFSSAVVLAEEVAKVNNIRTGEDEEVFVIGGEDVFRQAMWICEKIYLTRIHEMFDGDAFFPEIPVGFIEIHSEELAGCVPPCTFHIYERVLIDETA